MTMNEKQLRGLETVRLSVDAILSKVSQNRTNHKAEYENALAGWFGESTLALKQQLLLPVEERDMNFNLPKPENHLDDYDRVLDLLKMTLDKELELDMHEFNCYVRDQWDWSGRFKKMSQTYTVRKA